MAILAMIVHGQDARATRKGHFHGSKARTKYDASPTPTGYLLVFQCNPVSAETDTREKGHRDCTVDLVKECVIPTLPSLPYVDNNLSNKIIYM